MGSGDLLVFGRENRRIFHGVPKVFPGTAPDGLGLPPGRLSITVRETGLLVSARASVRDARRRASTGRRSLADLDDVGVGLTPPVLNADECRDARRRSTTTTTRFRSTIDMARHRFGEGQYRYFAHPLPDARRRAARRVLAAPPADRPRVGRPPRPARAVARRSRRLARAVPRGRPDPADAVDAALRDRRLERAAPRPLRRSRVPAAGRRSGSTGPATTSPAASSSSSSSDRARSHARPRPRSRAATRSCSPPATDRSGPARGWSNAPMRHGVSTVRSGRRHTLGLIFHDAK